MSGSSPAARLAGDDPRQPGGADISFQAYLDNIQAKTGRSPDEFRALAADKGFTEAGGLRKGVKAGEILDWLNREFDLGRGHGMAIVALLKGIKTPGDA